MRKNLHPYILRTLERNLRWHQKNGYGQNMTVDELLRQLIAVKAGSFTLLIEDGREKHHGNAAVEVFNARGVLIDSRVWFHPTPGQKIPKKTFSGTPIIDGTKPMKSKPFSRKQ